VDLEGVFDLHLSGLFLLYHHLELGILEIFDVLAPALLEEGLFERA
jgi:hypothetical protein